MKLGILFLIFFVTNGSDWYELRCSEMENLNLKGVVVKKRTSRSDRGVICSTKSKLGTYRKLSWVSSGSGLFGNSELCYYLNSRFLFATTMFWYGDVPQKGGKRAEVPSGQMEEVQTVFETEDIGVKLRRSLHYFENSNIDSLRIVLSGMDFDTLPLQLDEHERAVKSYKRIKSWR